MAECLHRDGRTASVLRTGHRPRRTPGHAPRARPWSRSAVGNSALPALLCAFMIAAVDTVPCCPGRSRCCPRGPCSRPLAIGRGAWRASCPPGAVREVERFGWRRAEILFRRRQRHHPAWWWRQSSPRVTIPGSFLPPAVDGWRSSPWPWPVAVHFGRFLGAATGDRQPELRARSARLCRTSTVPRYPHRRNRQSSPPGSPSRLGIASLSSSCDGRPPGGCCADSGRVRLRPRPRTPT